MKKIICLLLALSMVFALCSCGSKNENSNEETPTVQEHYEYAPILGVEVDDGENIGFYALTKDGTYSWMVTDKSGKTTYLEYDGIFCLDDEHLCTFTRAQTGGKITLKFTGSVVDFQVYQASCDKIENDRTQIVDDKYLVEIPSKTIAFPASGEYYYVVKVNYLQGEVLYGFLLSE